RGSEAARLGKKRSGVVSLPEPLIQAITTTLQGEGSTAGKELRREVKRMADILATTSGAQNTDRYQVMWGNREAQAYTSAYAPGAYATVRNVLSELRGRVDPEGWTPRRVLDFGCGPGTATWAVRDVWGDGGVEEVDGVDVSESMLTMAQEIQEAYQSVEKGEASAPRTTFHRFLSYASEPRPYDLVIASYVLGEMVDASAREATLKELWNRTGDVLVLVERGTPEGFRILESMRSTLLALENGKGEEGGERKGAHIVGPCPHERTCPMAGTTKWCHFPQRVQRPRFTMRAKEGSRHNSEDRKYSYLILRRGARPGRARSWAWPRLIDPPLKRDGHVLIDACVSDGTLERMTIPRSQGKIPYYDARKSRWGDLFPHPPK
ncbi:MAG: mitochondrial small ribosomal subunit Rsm22-domain-containing protein, partial [Piptocephalis tieghemiana]